MPAGLILTLVLAASVAGPRQDPPNPLPGEEPDARAEAAPADIDAELEGLAAHPWASRYFQNSSGLDGTILVLAPRAGLVLDADSCLGTSTSHGSVTQMGPRLLLKPSPAPLQNEGRATDLILLPVAWGQRRYLLLDYEVRDFCRDADRDDRKDTIGKFFLREGDEKRPASGRPRTLKGDLVCEPAAAPPD